MSTDPFISHRLFISRAEYFRSKETFQRDVLNRQPAWNAQNLFSVSLVRIQGPGKVTGRRGAGSEGGWNSPQPPPFLPSPPSPLPPFLPFPPFPGVGGRPPLKIPCRLNSIWESAFCQTQPVICREKRLRPRVGSSGDLSFFICKTKMAHWNRGSQRVLPGTSRCPRHFQDVREDRAVLTILLPVFICHFR